MFSLKILIIAAYLSWAAKKHVNLQKSEQIEAEYGKIRMISDYLAWFDKIRGGEADGIQ